MDAQGAQVAVAALGDHAQAPLLAGRVFARHQPEPGGQAAAAAEPAQVAGAGSQQALAPRLCDGLHLVQAGTEIVGQVTPGTTAGSCPQARIAPSPTP